MKTVATSRASVILIKAYDDVQNLSEFRAGKINFETFAFRVISRHRTEEGFSLDHWISFLEENENNLSTGSNSLARALTDFDNLITTWAEGTVTEDEWEWIEEEHQRMIDNLEKTNKF